MLMRQLSETRYVRTADGVNLAHRVVGDGAVDFIWSFNQLNDVEAIGEHPPILEYFDALAEFARVIVYDRRGMGRSGGDRGDLATDVDDLLALLGRNVVDNFETAIQRVGRKKGYIVAFSFGPGANAEVVRAKREAGLEIVLVKVSDLITEAPDIINCPTSSPDSCARHAATCRFRPRQRQAGDLVTGSWRLLRAAAAAVLLAATLITASGHARPPSVA